MNHGLIPLVGGKHRLAFRLVDICASTGADMFVDVFGGSAAVTIAAATRFKKLIYNDLDGDLVNLFQVISDRDKRRQLIQKLRWLPPSRRIFNEDGAKYSAGGHSFCRIGDPVERARCSLYRHCFAFGGKIRNGGFAVSPSCNDSDGNRERIREVYRYRNILRKISKVGEVFRKVLIENLDFSEIVHQYGRFKSCVLFVDPPYDGTESYYSRDFRSGQHAQLAEQLRTVEASVVCTFYKTPKILKLYPPEDWEWRSIQATKNSCLLRSNKVVTEEFVIIRKHQITEKPIDREFCLSRE